MKLERISVRFDGRTVLEDFALSLPSKGIVAVMAPSGAGKSTLLRVLAGLIPAPGAELSPLAGLRRAMVFQEDRLLPWLTVLDNITLVMEGVNQAEWARQALRQLGIGDTEALLPGSLSGGMRRRAALARALAVDPELMLLDEPFNGLDGEAVSAAAACIRRQAGRALVLVVTHQREHALLLTEDIRRFTGPPLKPADSCIAGLS